MTDASPRVFQTSGAVWLRDFQFGLTHLVVRKTGARVPYSRFVIADVWAWFSYFAAASRMKPMGPPFTIAYAPERARPWYLIWAVARVAGARLVKEPTSADVVMHFEDSTYSPNDPPGRLKRDATLVNYRCRDVSKTRVSEASATALGAPLAIDPTTYVGSAVEKSEINAAHDGRIVQCPMNASPGRAYQRLIDNRAENPELVEDLRTITVGGKAICVFIKRRPVSKRFLNTNSETVMREPEDVFTPTELESIAAFTRAMGMDWGGVDVLRDRADGRLYIVDANKTDMGPPLPLPLPDKLIATRKLAHAFRAFALQGRG